MSVVTSAQRTARRAGNSNALEMLTRAGFIGYGLVHVAVAWLALQIALGRSAGEGDQSGAFHVLLRQPMGRVLVIAIVVGLVAMSVWQFFEATVGHRDETGSSRTWERIASAGRTLIYTALAWTAYRVVAGVPTSSAGQQRKATAGMLAHPAGRWFVALAGLAVIALGVGLLIYGAKRLFEKRLNFRTATPKTRKTVVRLGQIGYLTKGFAFAIAGVLLALAALNNNAAQSTGLDGALRTLAARPFGVLLLIVVAAGLAAFGVYCFFQARFRKV
jgi:Domain of Unknown Function (DUF1206)